MAETDTSGITNPKRIIQKREDAAANGVDKGDLPGPAKDMFKPTLTMSQPQFSGYPSGGPKRGGPPPAEVLKKFGR